MKRTHVHSLWMFVEYSPIIINVSELFGDIVHEGYEIFLFPKDGSSDIYASSLRYAAFPFLYSAEITAYHETLTLYIAGEITVEQTCEQIIPVVDNRGGYIK